jgi:hypothetical protein
MSKRKWDQEMQVIEDKGEISDQLIAGNSGDFG